MEVGVTLPEEKLWGETRCVHKDVTHEVWHASPRAGGFSSRHYHERKPNKFYVVKGEIIVLVYRDGSRSEYDPFVLRAGNQLTVPEGVWHRFKAVRDSELIEVYWVELKPGADIVRSDEGGQG